jgi:AcrR family transcriptional regulator
MQDAEGVEATFPLLAERLPASPDGALDAVLDATVACVTRYGLAKTSLSDIARELGVAPSTVYRKIGTVEHATQLVMAREGHRLLGRMPEVIAGIEGPEVIITFLAEVIEATARHPMVARVLNDEDAWIGRLATRTLEERLADGTAVAAQAVVNQSCDEPNVTLGGIPARIISHNGATPYLLDGAGLARRQA